MRLMTPVHRVAWLAAASKHGVLELLRAGPRELGEIAEALDAPPESIEALRTWMRHGVLLDELHDDGHRYRLHGRLARHMADPAHPELAALAESLISVHVAGIYGALDHLRDGRPFASLDAPVVARVSEMTAPVMREVIDAHVPKHGPARLLELGCGSGRHLRYACERNPELEALGIELDPAIVTSTRRALGKAALADRARVRQGDLRTLELDERFDVVTMFNLVYYFPVAERGAVIAKAASWVKDGGALLIVTACRGGTLANNMMDLWFSGIREAGPLPEPEALVQQLRDAGLEPEAPARMLPGEAYYALVARRQSSQPT